MTYEDLVTSAIYKWRDNKGKGCFVVTPPIDDRYIVLGTLQAVFIKNPSIKPLILCDNYDTVLTLSSFITHQEYEPNNAFFRNALNTKQLRIYTRRISPNIKDASIDLLILYNNEDLDDYDINIVNKAHFVQGVFQHVIRNNYAASKLYAKCPPIEHFTQKQLTAARLSSPVEEMLIDVTIPEDSEQFKLLNYYNDYIASSLNMFGSLDNLNTARIGDTKANISAVQVCKDIAEHNGWNEHLDMSIPFNAQIDEMYNPANIRERASGTYEIIRKRTELVASNDLKCEAILNILNDNPTAKVLIFSRFADFAAKITDYINMKCGETICGNYHDKVEPIPAVDSKGKPILFKSGAKKGQQRYYAAGAQKSINLSMYNDGRLRVLSTNNAPDKTLACNVDIVIITSPLCNSIEHFIYRLSDVRFANKLKLFTVYVKNSLEREKIIARNLPSNHVVINAIKNDVITENNSNFIVVD